MVGLGSCARRGYTLEAGLRHREKGLGVSDPHRFWSDRKGGGENRLRVTMTSSDRSSAWDESASRKIQSSMKRVNASFQRKPNEGSDGLTMAACARPMSTQPVARLDSIAPFAISRSLSALFLPFEPYSASELWLRVPKAKDASIRLGCNDLRRTGLNNVSKKRGRWRKLVQHGDDWKRARRSDMMDFIAVFRCTWLMATSCISLAPNPWSSA